MKKKLSEERKIQIGKGINEYIVKRGKDINDRLNGKKKKIKPKVYA